MAVSAGLLRAAQARTTLLSACAIFENENWPGSIGEWLWKTPGSTCQTALGHHNQKALEACRPSTGTILQSSETFSRPLVPPRRADRRRGMLGPSAMSPAPCSVAGPLPVLPGLPRRPAQRWPRTPPDERRVASDHAQRALPPD